MPVSGCFGVLTLAPTGRQRTTLLTSSGVNCSHRRSESSSDSTSIDSLCFSSFAISIQLLLSVLLLSPYIPFNRGHSRRLASSLLFLIQQMFGSSSRAKHGWVPYQTSPSNRECSPSASLCVSLPYCVSHSLTVSLSHSLTHTPHHLYLLL